MKEEEETKNPAFIARFVKKRIQVVWTPLALQ
jgi:hypothetical protein